MTLFRVSFRCYWYRCWVSRSEGEGHETSSRRPSFGLRADRMWCAGRDTGKQLTGADSLSVTCLSVTCAQPQPLPKQGHRLRYDDGRNPVRPTRPARLTPISASMTPKRVVRRRPPLPTATKSGESLPDVRSSLQSATAAAAPPTTGTSRSLIALAVEPPGAAVPAGVQSRSSSLGCGRSNLDPSSGPPRPHRQGEGGKERSGDGLTGLTLTDVKGSLTPGPAPSRVARRQPPPVKMPCPCREPPTKHRKRPETREGVSAGQVPVLLGGGTRIRTLEGRANDFTDRSLWPLGYPTV